MKKLNISLLLFCFALLISCEKEYTEPSKFSDVSWYSSRFQGINHNVGLNKYASFTDLSQGATTHKWELLDDNCYFLKGAITRNDSVYDKFIDEGAGKETTDKTIHVLFKDAGLKRIRLYNEFTDSVAFKGIDTIIPAKKVGDIWVMDTTFIVDVYGDITPAYVLKDTNNEVITLGTGTDEAAWPVYEIMAGNYITLIDSSKVGRPNTRNWICQGGALEDRTALVTKLTMTRLGIYNVILQSSRTGLGIPGGWAQDTIPLNIKVIQSNIAFQPIGKLVETEEEKIQIAFNGEVDGATLAGEQANFVVNVKNTDASFDQDIAVKSIALVSGDATKLELELSDTIYNTDVITVSYSGGSIKSSDERDLEAFSALPVEMYLVNILDETKYGFEDGGKAWVPRSDNVAIISYVSTPVASGNVSLQMDYVQAPDKQGTLLSEQAKFSLEGGKYLYKYKLYVESGATLTSFNTWFLKTSDTGSWLYSVQFWKDISGIAKDTWVDVEHIKDAGEVTDTWLFIQLPAGGDGVFYFDDFYIAKLEPRP